MQVGYARPSAVVCTSGTLQT